MPIYEYLCEACGDKFEKLVRRTEEVLDAGCPSCGKKHLKQEFSTFSARAGAHDHSPSPAEMRSCPGGMCSNPGVCGMN
jgi:putative FmdB family regulatory protein